MLGFATDYFRKPWNDVMEFSSLPARELNLSRSAVFAKLLLVLSISLLVAPLARGSEVYENPFDPLILGSVESPASGQAEFTFASEGINNAYVKLSGGRLEKAHPETFANEAQIAVTPWGVQFNPFGNTRGYIDSIAIPDWYFPFPPDASGNHLGQQALQFVETFRDFSVGADQVWKDLQIQLVQLDPRPGQFDIGHLPSDGHPDGYSVTGSPGNNEHSLAVLPDTEVGPGFSVVDRFTFSHTGVQAGSSSSLLIRTQRFPFGIGDGTVDKATVLFLYNGAGDLVAYDESPNNHNVGTVIVTDRTDSKLDFNGDNPLPAGTYTLVVAGAGGNADLAGVTIDTVLLGTGAGDYQVAIQTSELPDACSAERIVSLLTTWHMLSVPCVPPAGSTMADLVGYDESRDATAPDSWVAYVYDTDDGAYQPLAADSPIPDPGVGFWFNTTEAVTLLMPAGSASTDNCGDNVSDSAECGAIDFPEASWSLLGNALDSPIGHADLNAYNESASGCYPDGCAIDQLHNQNASMQLWVYDHYRGSYVAFAQDQQKVTMPWDGYWARIDVSAPLYSDWTLSMPAFAVPIPQIVDIPLPEDGCFMMGSPAEEPGRDNDETLHEVCFENRFGAGRHEVTFAQYDAYAEATNVAVPPDAFGWGRADRPVINVSWTEAIQYIEWLNGITGRRYTLPTEAQWEYAARGGSSSAYWWGDSVESNRANCSGCGSHPDSPQTVPVGSFAGNGFGLHDTSGNVFEWTCSEYDAAYGGAEKICKTGQDGFRSVRGGGWFRATHFVRSANRESLDNTGNAITGFRIFRGAN